MGHEYIDISTVDKLLSNVKYGMRHEKAVELVLSALDAI